ncbi:MAG: helix-turn-helix transcriptional regulator [Clostridia bacterium]
MINKVHFGKRITSFRRRINLSQAELAEKLGVTSQAVSKWERGTALPDIELLLDFLIYIIYL